MKPGTILEFSKGQVKQVQPQSQAPTQPKLTPIKLVGAQ